MTDNDSTHAARKAKLEADAMQRKPLIVLDIDEPMSGTINPDGSLILDASSLRLAGSDLAHTIRLVMTPQAARKLRAALAVLDSIPDESGEATKSPTRQ